MHLSVLVSPYNDDRISITHDVCKPGGVNLKSIAALIIVSNLKELYKTKNKVEYAYPSITSKNIRIKFAPNPDWRGTDPNPCHLH